ncbi:hypothetical protein K466DRAFT_265206 [Polyporus arcularius HHB13444]|uniref:Uncharacterized protein n=1 Tax=Polyporus arcularius HHB13444 TaxID=1314778 RepID=A0A5C3P259_9APHY|nr:hypothetical protein K466DRAFT_265206 [Polyporus arcularius HHB13444]
MPSPGEPSQSALCHHLIRRLDVCVLTACWQGGQGTLKSYKFKISFVSRVRMVPLGLVSPVDGLAVAPPLKRCGASLPTSWTDMSRNSLANDQPPGARVVLKSAGGYKNQPASSLESSQTLSLERFKRVSDEQRRAWHGGQARGHRRPKSPSGDQRTTMTNGVSNQLDFECSVQCPVQFKKADDWPLQARMIRRLRTCHPSTIRQTNIPSVIC